MIGTMLAGGIGALFLGSHVIDEAKKRNPELALRTDLERRHGVNAPYIRRELLKDRLTYHNRPYNGKPDVEFTGDQATLELALKHAEQEASKRVDISIEREWVPKYTKWLEDKRLPKTDAHFNAYLRTNNVDTTELQFEKEQEVLRSLSDSLSRVDKRKVNDALGLVPDIR